MKVLSFSAVEILPALLDKSKTQTIRPAWKDKHPQWDKEPSKCIKEIREGFETKPRFQPKEQVTLMWKQRTSPKGSWFCRKHGIEMRHLMEVGKERLFVCGKDCVLTPQMMEVALDPDKIRSIVAFPKILGLVQIEEVCQIEMVKVDG